MGRTSATTASTPSRKGGVRQAAAAAAVWAKEQKLREAYDLLRQRKRDTLARRAPASATTTTPTEGGGPSTATPLDAAKIALAAGGSSKLVVSGETKDTGFKRPPKLQRKLDEIKENPPAAEEKAVKKRRVSSDEGRLTEEPPTYGYGGYFRGHLEEPVDGDHYPTTIFVGGLSEDTEERDLERAFSQFGPIDAIRLIHNKNFGFIKFRTPDACQASILGMNGEILGSTRIRVDRAKVPSARGPWRRRSWDPRPYPLHPKHDLASHLPMPMSGQGDGYYRQHRGSGEGSDESFYEGARERDGAYAPYGVPSLRGEPTPLPFPANSPASYSAPSAVTSPATSPALYRRDDDQEPRESGMSPETEETTNDSARRRVHYGDL